MKKEDLIKDLVSQFENQVRKLTPEQLEGLESGKFEISLTSPVGKESGGRFNHWQRLGDEFKRRK
ncbi:MULTISPECIES: hypothetical protein [Legionella]|uniref:Uncharacterized protein n=1 Tax=Legionella maceachernii TaxID=466 RepID=A0A0W0WGN3_9GAMM|nr:hypothetical protein [Legionella maceachernii]KTD31454.1 hypothetical protein Lmac_0202 [Legionella maceachernii]SJZ93761.1 hypothetical protein SAMN02745128_01510 [Legionella maceachernii]SUP03422.1 Uncharacterised protein [Legionella maceachernii]